MLSVKQGGIKYIFLVFGMTRPGIESWAPRLLANILTIMPRQGIKNKIEFSWYDSSSLEDISFHSSPRPPKSSGCTGKVTECTARLLTRKVGPRLCLKELQAGLEVSGVKVSTD